MSSTKSFIAVIFAIFILLSTFIFAEVPRLINYQGRLTDNTGTSVSDGPYLVKFNIYGSESGNDSLWSSGFRIINTNDGLFFYQLGSAEMLPDDIFSGAERWLGIRVGTDAEICPRIRLTSTPYSYQTLRSDTSAYATDIADNIVTENKIADNAITENKIADNSVHSAHIQDYSISAIDIGYEEITGDNIENGTIGFADIGSNGAAEGQVMKMVDGSWVAADDDIGAGGDITAVSAGVGLMGGATSGEAILAIADEGVINSMVADTAITNGKIADKAITSDKIQESAVTSTKIFNRAVISEKLDNYAVTTDKLADNAVTNSKLAANSITSDKIAPDAVGNEEIVVDAVGTPEIAADAVTSDKLADSSVTTSKLSKHAITNEKLDDNCVGTSKIAPQAVTSEQIANYTIYNQDINSAADIETSKISGTAVNLSSAQIITGDKTFGGTVYFGDSTMIVDNNGISIGDTATSSDSYLIQMDRTYLTGSARYGIHSEMENFGGGSLYGYRCFTNSYGGGIAYGVRTSVYSNNHRYGVYGHALDNGDGTGYSYGVLGSAQNGEIAYGVYGSVSGATTNWAGYFTGNVNVIGTLIKGGGSFRIDHPLDPENKYLQHSFVESPDMMNVYNGNIILDDFGKAVVELPEYFEALNKDFRYQLTAIGGPGPNLYIAEMISGNHFVIAGGQPGSMVSWQVTGVRKDNWAESNRIQVELDKPGYEKGLYLHPESFGFGRDKFINYKQEQAAELEEERRDK